LGSEIVLIKEVIQFYRRESRSLFAEFRKDITKQTSAVLRACFASSAVNAFASLIS
jgi:hypothetical protein